MQTQRIIFLDIDGVLNSLAWKMVRPYHKIDGYDKQATSESDAFLLGELDLTPIALMDELLKDTGAKIVVSSSWRLMRPGYHWLQALFQRRGARLLADAIIGVTPHLTNQETRCQRGKEVELYLRQNAIAGKYLCIDDCSLHYLANQPYVETNPGIGFSILDYHDALDLLH